MRTWTRLLAMGKERGRRTIRSISSHRTQRRIYTNEWTYDTRKKWHQTGMPGVWLEELSGWWCNSLEHHQEINQNGAKGGWCATAIGMGIYSFWNTLIPEHLKTSWKWFPMLGFLHRSRWQKDLKVMTDPVFLFLDCPFFWSNLCLILS